MRARDMSAALVALAAVPALVPHGAGRDGERLQFFDSSRQGRRDYA
jgi:hypothetical protein